MARQKLSEKQWDALDALRFSTTEVAVFRNATIILMTDVGRSKLSIAADLGCSPGTVDNARRLLKEEGFSFQRPKHTMKGKRDEAAYAQAERKLKRLKKGRWPKLATLS